MYWPEVTESRKTSSRPLAEWDRSRVLVACDGRLVAEALMFSLETDPTLDAIGYGLDAWEALAYTESLEPDVVVVGPRLNGLNPFEFCRLTHELFPHMLLIMLCDRLVPADVEAAYAIGVSDCLPVARSVDQLLSAISDARARRATFERGRRQAMRRPSLTLVQRGDLDACA